MPELPEVETVCRGLAPLVTGRRIAKIVLRRADLRVPFPADLEQRVTARRIERVRRRAKYILLDLDSEDVLVLHLGMSGRLTVAAGPLRSPGKHDHFWLELEGGTQVTLTDPRRFGLVLLVRSREFEQHKLFAALGP